MSLLPEPTYTDYVELRRSSAPAAPPAADNVRYYSDEDGALRLLLADGTDAAVGEDGGSMPVQTISGNGLKKDWDLGDLAGVQTLLIDASPTEWEAQTEYVTWDAETSWHNMTGARVHPVDDDSRNFIAAYRTRGQSGDSEPDWDSPEEEDGQNAVIDNDIAWTPVGTFVGSWEAETPYGGGGIILANGSAFQSTGGTSDDSEPDWTSASDYGETVSDNDITWQNLGPLSVWQADHEYTLTASPDGTAIVFDKVVPTSEPATVWSFNHRLHSGGQSGASEPEWADLDSHGYLVDGDILWHEDTDDSAEGGTVPPTAAITGLVAPSGPAIVDIVNLSPNTIIRLEDEAEVENDFPSASFNDSAASEAANQFSFDDQNFDIGPGNVFRIAYDGDHWTYLSPVS